MQKNKFWIIGLLVFTLVLAACGGAAAPAPAEQPAPAAEEPTAAAPAATDEEVTLTMGSWRVDDVAQMNAILDAFHAEHPNITIKFDPTNP
ncbi:MAG: hypothetical protein J5I90_02080, partial [Caldilineales bacterium]|nr:hypothetical protein [Caldilineales bacterium]